MGRILNTLHYRVNQEEKEWKSKSTLRKEYAYGKLRGILIHLSRKPAKWAFILLIFFGLLTFVISQLPVEWLVSVKSEFNTPDLISYFSTLWSVQATIVALIYPIVIAFVTLLLQRRHSAKSYLNIYLHDTSALLSGLCTIGLIFLMGIQYLFIPSIVLDKALNWLYIDAVYFLLNLVLTSYFLYQTFEYIKPANRLESLRKYLINEIWPIEFKRLLSSLLFRNAIAEELLKVKGVDNNIVDIERPSIWTDRDFSSLHGDPILVIDVPNNSQLVDVRFRFLSWVAKSWAKKVKGSNKEKPVLIFPLRPGLTYSGQTTLCKIQGSVKLSSFHKQLIKWSFKFQKNKTEPNLQVGDLLDDLSAEVLRSLRSGETQTFSEALDDLIEFIALLILASAIPNADKIDNYSIIVDPNKSIFGRPVYEEWFDRINKLFEPATDRIVSDDTYISHLIHTPKWLFLGIEKQAHIKILQDVLALSKYLSYRISSWWIKTIENQGIVEHDKCHAVSLLSPYHGTYENILRSFIGQWESLKNNHFIPRKEEEQSWSLIQTKHPLFESHLNITGELLLDSIYKGDKSRTKYFVDTLLKWYSGLRSRLDFSAQHLIDDSQFITLDHLKLPWNKIEHEHDFESLRFLNHEPPILIFSVAIQNYWMDVCCVLLYKLAKSTLTCEKLEDSPLVDSFKAIFYGEHPLKTGSLIANNEKTLKDANSLFAALIRQNYSGFHSDQQYRRRLDNLVEKITPSLGSTMIPGRVYSSSSGEDLRMLRDGMLLTLILLVQNKWDPVQKYNPLIKKWISENFQQVEILTSDLEGWINRLKDEDFDKFEPVYDILSKDNSQKFKDSREIVIEGLESFKEEIEAVHLELIKSLEIDDEKLIQIEKWCSKKPFSRSTGLFPVPLFKQVTITTEGLIKHEWIFRNLEKGGFTEPLLALSGPDKQLYKDLLVGHVESSIWHKTLINLSIEKIKVDSADAYWGKVKEYENTLITKGKTPILIINSISDPIWIRDWTHLYGEDNSEIPDDLEFSKRKEIKLKSYLGHFNQTEVHKANTLRGTGTSILMAKESFKELQVTQNDNGNLVSVVPEVKDDPTLLDLNFIWKFRVSIEPIDAWLLRHEF